MKIRQGFVSNSSSSSFVCGICHQITSGMDLSKSDCEMVECPNGHLFHEGCNKTKMKIDFAALQAQQIQQIEANKYLEAEEKNEIIEELKATTDKDEINDVLGEHDFDTDYEISDIECPFCQLLLLEDNALLAYLLKESGKSREEHLKDIRQKYGSYDKFAKELKIEPHNIGD